MKVTSALANKLLIQLKGEKDIYIQKEIDSNTYVVSDGEEALIPEYDFLENNKKIEEIDIKIMKLKHAINLTNTLSKIEIEGKTYSVDEILVRMAELNARMRFYDELRRKLPKERLDSRRYISRNNSNAVEYKYTNYKVEDAKAEFERTQKEIIALQLGLDKFNKTFEFEVEF